MQKRHPKKEKKKEERKIQAVVPSTVLAAREDRRRVSAGVAPTLLTLLRPERVLSGAATRPVKGNKEDNHNSVSHRE
jgi:hypothetical protein